MGEEYNCLSEKQVLEIIDKLKRHEGELYRRVAKVITKHPILLALTSGASGTTCAIEGAIHSSSIGVTPMTLFIAGMIGGMSVPFGMALVSDSIVSSDQRLYERIPWSAKIYPKIVLNRTRDFGQYREAVALENEVYTWARNIDLYSEKGADWNKRQAEAAIQKVVERSKEKFGQDFSKRLEGLPPNLVEFFPYEAGLWEKIKSDVSPADEAIRKYVEMRGSDALLHGEIVKGFTNEDWSEPMWACMQLKDISNDREQYRSDFEKNLPNVYYMFGAQEKRIRHMSSDSISAYATDKVMELKEDIRNRTKTFDYKNCGFLQEETGNLCLGTTKSRI